MWEHPKAPPKDLYCSQTPNFSDDLLQFYASERCFAVLFSKYIDSVPAQADYLNMPPSTARQRSLSCDSHLNERSGIAKVAGPVDCFRCVVTACFVYVWTMFSVLRDGSSSVSAFVPSLKWSGNGPHPGGCIVGCLEVLRGRTVNLRWPKFFGPCNLEAFVTDRLVKQRWRTGIGWWKFFVWRKLFKEIEAYQTVKLILWNWAHLRLSCAIYSNLTFTIIGSYFVAWLVYYILAALQYRMMYYTERKTHISNAADLKNSIFTHYLCYH